MSEPTNRRPPRVPPPTTGGRQKADLAGSVLPGVRYKRGLFSRRWPRRVLLATNFMVAILIIAAGSVYGYANWRFNQIGRVLIPSIHHFVAGGGGAKPEPPGAPFTVLVVGSDSRSVLSAPGDQKFQSNGPSHVSGQRSDTIMLVHIDPKNTRASIMSIPRDLWVQIPGKPYKNRINSTFDTGPDLLVQAIQQDLGIPIDHYVEVNFDSFRQVVNAVGGIKEYFPTPARDWSCETLPCRNDAGLLIPKAGCVNISGNQALAFVRSRHYQYLTSAGWQSEPQSDLARVRRQQSFVKKMIAKAQSTGLTDPLRLNGVIAGITSNVKLDTGFSQSQLLSLAKRFRTINPSTLPSSTLPTTQAVIGGAQVLLLKQPDAQQAIDLFLGKSPTAPASGLSGPVPTNVKPGDVRISVHNGSGRTREASTVAGKLRSYGFNVVSFGDADNHNYATTLVRYSPGAEDKARYVASLVQGAVQLQADATMYGADVVLVTGQSYTGLAAPGTAITPTTSAPPPSTTIPPAAAPTTVYELPGAPPGFVPPPC